MFGEEIKPDIVTYQSAVKDADNGLTLELVMEAFKAEGKSPLVDVLPSKQLAVYELFDGGGAVALIGSREDLAVKDKKHYSVVAFYFKKQGDEQVVLIFSNARGIELHKAFVEGMQKLIKSGKYLTIIEKSRGKLPADYVSRIKHLNPGWK
jgi:hypothetical protein